MISSIIIAAIGTMLFVMYATGIAADGAVLIASAILIVGGMIKIELAAVADMLNDMFMPVSDEEIDYDELMSNKWEYEGNLFHTVYHPIKNADEEEDDLDEEINYGEYRNTAEIEDDEVK